VSEVERTSGLIHANFRAVPLSAGDRISLDGIPRARPHILNSADERRPSAMPAQGTVREEHPRASGPSSETLWALGPRHSPIPSAHNPCLVVRSVRPTEPSRLIMPPHLPARTPREPAPGVQVNIFGPRYPRSRARTSAWTLINLKEEVRRALV